MVLKPLTATSLELKEWEDLCAAFGKTQRHRLDLHVAGTRSLELGPFCPPTQGYSFIQETSVDTAASGPRLLDSGVLKALAGRL